jgi:hypothetical protein
MSRLSQDEFDGQGVLLNGFDYENQAWVADGKYIRCGHPDSMACGCYGKEHEGQPVRVSVETIDLDTEEPFDTPRELPKRIVGKPIFPRKAKRMRLCDIPGMERGE